MVRRFVRLRETLLPNCSTFSCIKRDWPKWTSQRTYATGVSHYETLSVPRDATTKEIKARFYELSRKYHPDVSPDSAKKFTEINAAYSVLRGDATRRDYDRTLPHERGSVQTAGSSLRTASGLSRRRTRPMGTPPSSPFRASASPSGSRPPPGFEFGTNPAADGDIRNNHFTFDEHRERHSAFDSRYKVKLQEELSRRNAELKDNFFARFFGIAGLMLVVIMLTGGISSIRAEVHDNQRTSEPHQVAWSEAMKTKRHVYEHQFWKTR